MNLQIASAAEQQAAVAEEINQNIINISTIANESTVNTEHTSATSESLTQLSHTLNGLIERFRLT